MKSEHKLDLPRRLQIEFSRVVQEPDRRRGRRDVARRRSGTAFQREYLTRETPLKLNSCTPRSAAGEKDQLDVNVYVDGEIQSCTAPATARSRRSSTRSTASPQTASTSGCSTTPSTRCPRAATRIAAAYVECAVGDEILWGVGLDANIVTASLKAVISAVNRA